MNVSRIFVFCFSVFLFFSFQGIGDLSAQSLGDDYVKSSDHISVRVNVIDEVMLSSSDYTIQLWGVKKVNFHSPFFELNARTALENIISGQEVTCHIQARGRDIVQAQCVNAKEEDIALRMLQLGYVTLDRSNLYGTVYQDSYLEAEFLAQSSKRGIWGLNLMTGATSSDTVETGNLRHWSVLAIFFVVAISLISFYIMQGFGRVVHMQNKTMDLAIKERDLKEREKNVIASMIHAEIRENKPKIEAYLTVYREVLHELSQAGDSSQFLKAGEIVQKQPSLERAVFDGNTGKLDMLGAGMASGVIHYYARIKSVPDYVELKPDMALERVRDIVENCVERAEKLEVISASLLEDFYNSSMIQNT